MDIVKLSRMAQSGTHKDGKPHCELLGFVQTGVIVPPASTLSANRMASGSASSRLRPVTRRAEMRFTVVPASSTSLCCLSTRGVLQAFSDVQVHPNGFGLGEILDGRRAVLATKAGIAYTAPRQPHIGIAIGVDPDGAGICFLRETLDASDVATPYPSREAVGSAVGDA